MVPSTPSPEQHAEAPASGVFASTRPRLFLLTAALYAVGSLAALTLAEWSDLSGVLFLPAGVTVGFLLRSKSSDWWVVLAGAGLAEAILDAVFGLAAAAIPGFVLANTMGPLVGATIVRRALGGVDLRRRRDLWWFAGGAVIIGPAVSAFIGSGSNLVFTDRDALDTFLQWWLGDGVGVVLAGGLILSWGTGPNV